MPFLTQFKIMKLKIDTFSIFMNSFVEQSVDKPLVIRKCRITLLTKFMMMKLKTDVFSVSMIFL